MAFRCKVAVVCCTWDQMHAVKLAVNATYLAVRIVSRADRSFRGI